MSTLWVALLWIVAGAMCAVLVHFWAGAWRLESGRRLRAAITVSGAIAAVFAVSIPAAVADGWVMVLGRPADFLARTGVLAAVAILAWSRVGDPARGRRRCPRCWYDMSGTPGLVCGECGRDAGSEERLLLAKPRWRIVVIAALPLGLAVGIVTVSLARDPAWARRLPDVGLVLASPAAAPGTGLTHQMITRVERFDRPERALQRVVSRGVITRTQDPGRVLIHARMLDLLGSLDASVYARLVALTADPSVSVRLEATRLLARAPIDDAAVRQAVLGLLSDGDYQVRETALSIMIAAKRRSPGGAAPPEVLAELAMASRRSYTDASRIFLLLRLFDPTDEAREAMFGVIESAAWYTTSSMLVAVSRMFPDDPRSAAMLASHVKRLSNSSNFLRDDAELINELIDGDHAARSATGELSAARRALYADEMVLRQLYHWVLNSGNTRWILWYVEHPALRDDVRLTMLKAIQYRPEFTRAVLAQAARLGPAGEPFRDLAVQKVNDPVHGPAARKALEAMGPAPSPPSTIPR